MPSDMLYNYYTLLKMVNQIKVNNIFAAVSDKSVLDPLLEVLKARQAGQRPGLSLADTQQRPGLSLASKACFWGTEGTVKYLKSKGFSATSVVSGFDFDGRVKSLDRAIFARILADRGNKKHLEEIKNVILSEAKNLDPSPSVQDDNYAPFDLIIVDLYPQDANNFPESMDIGGQALIRAAIKNYKNVALAFDAGSLASLVSELVSNSGSTTLEFRKLQAQKAAKFIAERSGNEASLL